MYLIVPYFAGDVDTFSALLFTDDMIMTLDIFTGVFLFHSSASVLRQFRISGKYIGIRKYTLFR